MDINRREFVRFASLGIAAAEAVRTEASTGKAAQARGGARAGSARKALMKVGTQHDSSADVLGILAALGVTNICSRLPSARFDDQWSVEGLTRLRERVEHFGITLDMVPLPMSSNPIARAENPNILL